MIYFITDGEYTKIGKSNNPINRLKELQTANARVLRMLYVFDVPNNVEVKLHTLFYENATEANNEWFDLRDVNILTKLNVINIPELLDIKKAEFKARQLNKEIKVPVKKRNKIDSYKKIRRSITNLEYEVWKGSKGKRIRVNKMISEIADIIRNKEDVIINYSKLASKYKMSRSDIREYIKYNHMSKKVFDHNERVIGPRSYYEYRDNEEYLNSIKSELIGIIKGQLKTKKSVISYGKLASKYSIDKKDVSKLVKKAKLSKKVMLHNKKYINKKRN